MSGTHASLLVFGKSGQVAAALAEAGGATCLGRGDVDVLSRESVAAAISAHAPQAVINAAAYTAVDKAESDREQAMALNAVAPGTIAWACAAADVPLVHLSTDYVFDGAGGAPYPEGAPVSPLNVYGESKARGEGAVLSASGRAAVLRTSWVFSERPGNFVTTMLRLAGEREEISVVADIAGRPTSSHSLARACIALADAMMDDRSAGGVYHFTNDGEASWSVLAEAVMDEARTRGWKAARIRPIASADHPAQARRPQDSRLATGRIERLLGRIAPHWRVALGETLDRLGRV